MPNDEDLSQQEARVAADPQELPVEVLEVVADYTDELQGELDLDEPANQNLIPVEQGGALAPVYLMEPRDDHRIRRDFVRSVRDMKKAIDAMVVPLCTERGITSQMLSVLMELDAEDAQTLGALSDRLDILRPNFTVLCRKLLDLGLVRRERCCHDRRQAILRITPAGTALLHEIEDAITEVFDANLASADKESFETIIEGINAMRNLMGGIRIHRKVEERPR